MRKGWLLPILLAFLPGTSQALEMKAGSLEGSHRIEVLAGGPERIELRFEVGSFFLNPVTISGETYSTVTWDGGDEALATGMPALPGFRESVVIPDDTRMTIRVLASEYQDFPGVRVAPSKGPITRDVDPASVPWTFDDVYTRNAWYPEVLASLGEPYILRDERGTVVAIDPFRWNPVTRTLRVYTSITVEVTSAGPGGANVLTNRPEHRVAEFEKIYARHFLNWGQLPRYNPVAEAGPMVVVAADAFLAATQPLVDWKNQMGVPTTLVPMSQIGTTAAQLKTYMQSAFTSPGVCFILLVGDYTQVPYYVNAGGAADPMLTLLAGSDSYPDAFVGRISADTEAQVQTQVERIVEYERNPDPLADWYAKGIAIASNEGDGYGDDGEADWEHAQNYRGDLLHFTYTMVNELYDGYHPSGAGQGVDQPGNPSASNVSSLVNVGRGLIHYTGHGSVTSWATTGFGISNVNALTNDNMLPFVVSVGCVNGQFVGTTCFAESWMRATHNGEPSGAIACYMSTVNQQWATPMKAQDEMIDLLCAGEKWTFGGNCFNGSCAMIDRYGANGITEFKNWTVFGDPSLQMRTATPATLAVTHNDSVDPSVSTFDVTTEPWALVALSDQFTLLGSTFANAVGLASVPFDPLVVQELDEVTLTVTGFNRTPSVETLPVVTGATAVAEVAGGILVGQNQPNPFDRSTGISLALDREQRVQVAIFDVSGRKIRTLQDGVLTAGPHQLVWDGTTDAGRAVASGTYYYRLVTADRTETRRMVRLR